MPSTVLEPAAAEVAAHAGRVDVDVLEAAVSIALTGGPDDRTPDWKRWASCSTSTTDELYAGGVTRSGKELLRRCREDCAVQAECLAYALGNGEREGIWGGTTDAGRRRLRNVLRDAGFLGVVGEEAYIAWRDESADREPVAPPERRRIDRPWPHQAAAVAAVVDEISTGGPCQISMATASGKTHVALWAADELPVDQVLVLVPSLSLITQTAAIWRSDARWAETPMLAVCSDTGGELEATTDPMAVRAIADRGPCVVFATYQSSEVLVEAGVEWGLVIADEAHHLAGDVDKAYAAIVRREIPAARTLYMTATPRRYRRKRDRSDVELVSMDDERAFGPRVFTFSLSDAIAAGVVADYRVIVAAVDQATFDKVAAHPELVDVDPHLLAGAIAVVQTMAQQNLSSCVSFHTKVDRARRFSALIGQVADLFPDLRPDHAGWAGFVHGAASVSIRERLLARLSDPRTWGVLANAKALGEGVDLPALDAVAIVDPKNSETDVLQATGRALRVSGDKVGTVLLPVLLASGGDPDDPLSGLDERSIDIVSGVLRALRAHDADLGSRLDTTRRALTRRSVGTGRRASDIGLILRQSAARHLLRSRVEFHLPGGALGDLAGAMALHLVRETTATWEESFARLQIWTDEHGTCRIPQSDPEPAAEGLTWTLGGWCSRQRTLFKRGLLPPERVEQLEALPGWIWDGRAEPWWEKLEVLRGYVDEHGKLPGQFDEWRGVKVGNFLWGCRAGYKDHEGRWLQAFPDRVAALEAIPGWSWDARTSWWEGHYEQLAAWAAEYGHAHPSAGDLAPDGFDLGKWVAKERQKIRAGKRTAEEAERLRSLPGWIDDFRDISDQLWQDGYERTRRYMELHGQQVPQAHVEADGYRLGAWGLKMRQGYAHPHKRRGSLTAERVALLEAIPGWSWAPHEARWERCFEVLQRVAPDRLSTRGVLVMPEQPVDGIDLGSWVYGNRVAYREGRLQAERIALLEAIPGWAWTAPVGRRAAS